MKSAACSLALAALLAFAGCGSDDEKTPADTVASGAASQPAATSTAPAAAPTVPGMPSTETAPPDTGGTTPQPAPGQPSPAPATPPAQKGVVTQKDAARVKLGASQTSIRERFGPPAATPKKGKVTCLVYPTDAGPDTWERFCFVGGKLGSLAIVIGRKTALTIEPPPVKGGPPGKPIKPNNGQQPQK
jgi:hypothetical protein